MINDIIDKFNVDGELVDTFENNSGIINSTFVVTLKDKNGSNVRYLIQKINTTVFPEPNLLMQNIEEVTSYLRRQLRKNDDNKHRVLELIKTKKGENLCTIEVNGSRNYYRMYRYIENAIAYNSSDDANIVFNTGKAFGNFQKLLKDFPIKQLDVTIPDFHNTVKRFEKLYRSIRADSEGRVSETTKEIVFLLKRYPIYSEIIDKLGTEDIPYRVIHNDSKVSNVMMDKNSGEYCAVIDLDTVMPGSLLFDYGDGVRSTASTSAEDETDISKIGFNVDLFKSYTDGFLSEMAPFITDMELNMMGKSILIISLELAMRFLTDYLNGDTYFKISYPNQNLNRTRCQIELAKKIEKNMDFINEYIIDCYNKYKIS